MPAQLKRGATATARRRQKSAQPLSSARLPPRLDVYNYETPKEAPPSTRILPRCQRIGCFLWPLIYEPPQVRRRSSDNRTDSATSRADRERMYSVIFPPPPILKTNAEHESSSNTPPDYPDRVGVSSPQPKCICTACRRRRGGGLANGGRKNASVSL